MAEIRLTEAEIKALDALIAIMQEEESGTPPTTVAKVDSSAIPLFTPAAAAVTARATGAAARATAQAAQKGINAFATAGATFAAAKIFAGSVAERASITEEQIDLITHELENLAAQEVTLEQLLEVRRNIQRMS